MNPLSRVMSMPIALLLAMLTGCGAGFTGRPVSLPLGMIQGRLHGGQAPIVGSHVHLLAASTTGYAGPGLAASSANLSSSLLSGTVNTDSLGGYVTTDANGFFTITGDYNCIAGTQVYAYATGGNSGGGANSSIGLIAILGTCPPTGSFASTVPYIWINEVSTIAAAYAMAGFATDATHVGIGPVGSASVASTVAITGLANAFSSASNLASLSTGVASATTAGGNGTVPQAEINTLANILAACVNASDSSPANCSTLFAATPNGTSTPSDTATAAINIAQNPAANVGSLFPLQAGIAAPFLPDLGAAPNDFTIHILYSGGGLTKPTYATPHTLAVDGNGNIWNANYVVAAGNLSEFSTLGVVLSGATGYTGGGLKGPFSLAIDNSTPAQVLIANFGGNTLSEFTSAGTPVTGSPFTPSTALSNPVDAEFDGAGNIWVDNLGGFLTKLTSASAFTSKSATTDLSLPYGIALAAGTAGNVWVANNSTNATGKDATEYTNADIFSSFAALTNRTYGGVAVDADGNGWYAELGKLIAKVPSGGTTATEYTVGGSQFITPTLCSDAIDGAGNVWMTDYANGTLYKVSNSGANLSGVYGFIIPGNTGYGISSEVAVTTPNSIVVDNAGNIWYTSLNGASLHELVGAGVPVATPISYAVTNSLLGSRP